jgi:hypothetical protein
MSRMNALFRKSIEYPQGIEQSFTGALRRGVAVIAPYEPGEIARFSRFSNTCQRRAGSDRSRAVDV